MAISARASGSQMRIERVTGFIPARSGRGDQEVEGTTTSPGSSRRRSSAGTRSGRGAPRPSRSARRQSAARDAAGDDDPLEHRSAKRPSASAGRTTTRSISSSKYHLLTSKLCSRANAACNLAAVPGDDVDAVGDRDAAQPDHGPDRQADPRGVVARLRRRGASGAPVNAGARKLLITWSTPGSCRKPPITASIASRVIAIFIAGSRSAITCSGPGKPTSVSSSSPVSGVASERRRERGGHARARPPPGRARRRTRGRSCGTCRARSAARPRIRGSRAPRRCRRGC